MEDLARRRMRAQELLDDPILMDALARLEHESVSELLKTKGWFRIADRKRTVLIERIDVIRSIRQELHTIILSGKLADYPRAVGA